MVIPEFLQIKEAHRLVEDYGHEVLRRIRLEGEFHSHIDPCAQAYCKRCDVDPCPIRQEPSLGRRSLSIQEATTPEADHLPQN
jgi:hypothetical protein